MKNAWARNALANPPAVPANPSIGYPTGGDPASAVPPTEPGAYWFHMITMELLNVVAAAGLTPSTSDLTQLLQALAKLFAPRNSGVLSAFGRTGDVVAKPGDYSIDQIANAVTTVFGRAGPVVAAVGDYNIGQITGAVTSVFGRSGPVTAAAGDYNVLQVTGALGFANFKGGNQSLGANGFQCLPGGLIMQWGTVPIGQNVAATFGYPMTFPNVSFAPLVTSVNTPYTSAQAPIQTALEVVQFNTTGAVIQNKQTGVLGGTALTLTASVLVFGY